MAGPLDHQAGLVEACMVHLLSSTDTASLKAAEAQLKAALARKDSPAVLLLVIERSAYATARQMAGVFMRRRVVAWWNRQKAAGRLQLQQLLLQRLAVEPERPVRKALIACVSALGKALLPGNNWPDVLVLLDRAMREPAEDVRELAMLLLLELVEGLGARSGEFAAPHFLPLLLIGLRGVEPSGKVRRAALRAACGLLGATSDERALQLQLCGLLEPFMSVTAQCLGGSFDGDGAAAAAAAAAAMAVAAAGAAQAVGGAGALPHAPLAPVRDEDAACKAFECLGELVSAGSPVVAPHIESIVRAMAAVLLRASSLDVSTRDAAAQVVHEVLGARPRLVARRGLLTVLLPAAMAMLAEYDVDLEREAVRESREAGVAMADFEGAEFSWGIGGRLLDDIAVALPERLVFNAVWAGAEAWAASPDWRQRHAALVAIGIVCEGCSGLMREEAVLPRVLSLVLSHARDPDVTVRLGVCHALCMMAEYLSPRFALYHAQVLPAVFELMSGDGINGSGGDGACNAVADADENEGGVTEKGSEVLESFCEGMDAETIAPYLPALMGLVSRLLGRPGQGPSAQERLLVATGSIAVAAGAGFLPYVPAVAASLVRMMRATDERLLRLRGKATASFGQVAVACGAAAVAPFFLGALQAAAESLELFEDNLELQEDTFHLLSSLAEVFGGTAEFVALLPQLVDKLIEAGMSRDGTEIYRDEGYGEAADRLAQQLEDFEAGPEGDGSGGGDDEGGGGGGGRRGGRRRGFGGGSGEGGHESGGSEDSDEDDGESGQHVRMRVRTSYVDVKCAAVRCLGHCMGFCPPAVVAPFLARVSEVVLNHASKDFHGSVRVQGVHALVHIVKAQGALCGALVGAGAAPVALAGAEAEAAVLQFMALPPGGGVRASVAAASAGAGVSAGASSGAGAGAGVPTLPAAMAGGYGYMLTELLEMVRSDPEPEVASNCCATVAEWCGLLGGAAVASHADALMKALLLVLRGRAGCQREDESDDEDEGVGVGGGGEDEDDEDEDGEGREGCKGGGAAVAAGAGAGDADADADSEEDADHGKADLLDEAADCIVAVARCLGAARFTPFLGDVVRELLRLSAKGRPALDVILAVGCIGELAAALGAGFAACVPGVVPRLLACMADAEAGRCRDVQRNCAFALGTLAETCPLACQPVVPHMLSSLQHVFPPRLLRGGSAEAELAIDNGVSALLRILAVFPQAAPLAATLPAALAVLPMRRDHAEDAAVYGALLWLLRTRVSEVASVGSGAAEAGRLVVRRVLELLGDAAAGRGGVEAGVARAAARGLGALLAAEGGAGPLSAAAEDLGLRAEALARACT